MEKRLPLKIFPLVIDRTGVDTILSYCHYSLHDSALQGLIPYLNAKGVGIISASALGMGLLTDGGPAAWHPAPESIRQACAAAAAHCRAKGADVARLAVQWAVRNTDIATTLVGTADPENLQRNVRWIEQPLDETLLAEVAAMVAPIHNMTWPSGGRENH